MNFFGDILGNSSFSKKIILIVVILGSFVGLWAKKKPDWVISRPINQNYYIGIGVAEKSKDNLDYIQIAKDNALKNLASEININVSGDVISKVIEKSGISQDEIKSEIRTSTTANLEGYEVVGTYEDKNGYLTLLSDAYITVPIKENCDFAITSEVSFAHLKNSFKGNKRVCRKSSTKYLYEKGSIFIDPSPKLLENLRNENLQKIGYNIYTLGEKK